MKKPDPPHPYASRGGLKLAAALEAFKLDVHGYTCADLGCNTGGFTDCLLQHGAANVYAVDTGYGALAWKLRQDPRVVVLERTNALHFDPRKFENFHGCDLVTIDLAWTRQSHAIPASLRWLKARGLLSPGFLPRIITLIKPHYEAPKELLVKGVLDEANARRVLDSVLSQLPGAGAAPGVRVVEWIESPIRGGAGKGKSGNTEYLALLEPISRRRSRRLFFTPEYKPLPYPLMLGHLHQRIAEKSSNMGAPPVLIVALGDSVTHGLMANNVLDQEGVYHFQLWKMLVARYPACVFSVINAGVGGDTAAGGLARLDRDVIRHQPDLVLVGYALNDSGGGDDGLPNFTHALANIAGRVRKETHGDVILFTPNFTNSRDNDRVADEHRKMGLIEKLMQRQNSGLLGRYADAVRSVAARLEVSLADVYAEWEKLAAKGVDTTAMLSNGLNHPDTAGHKIAADAIMRVVEAE